MRARILSLMLTEIPVRRPLRQRASGPTGRRANGGHERHFAPTPFSTGNQSSRNFASAANNSGCPDRFTQLPAPVTRPNPRHMPARSPRTHQCGNRATVPPPRNTLVRSPSTSNFQPTSFAAGYHARNPAMIFGVGTSSASNVPRRVEIFAGLDLAQLPLLGRSQILPKVKSLTTTA